MSALGLAELADRSSMAGGWSVVVIEEPQIDATAEELREEFAFLSEDDGVGSVRVFSERRSGPALVEELAHLGSEDVALLPLPADVLGSVSPSLDYGRGRLEGHPRGVILTSEAGVQVLAAKAPHLWSWMGARVWNVDPRAVRLDPRSRNLARNIGRAVEAARKRVGISLKDLAESTSLDAALVGSIVRGERLVSTSKLDRIASTLGIDAFALYGGREVERALVVLPRHAARRDFQQEDLPVLRRALERATALREVSAILGQKSLADQFEPRPPGAEPAQDGYHCARLVRRALGRTTEPLDSLPTVLAEEFHVAVVTAPLSTGALLAAAVRSSASRAAAVVLNPSVVDGPMPGTFQAWLVDRVSICHELCHILFDEPKGGVVDVVLDDDPPREGQEKSPIEQRAGAFAAELLIPLHGLRKLLGKEGGQTDTPARADRLVDEVRRYWRTPAEIAVNHLYNYGYVAKVSAFREDLIGRAKGRVLPEPSIQIVDDSHAWRRVLLARTREAHDSCLITDGAARALLELPAGEPLPWEREVP